MEPPICQKRCQHHLGQILRMEIEADNGVIRNGWPVQEFDKQKHTDKEGKKLMLDPRIALVEKKFVKTQIQLPTSAPATLLKCVRLKEGNRERIQIFEGVVIGRQHGGIRENFIVRKMSNGVGVEREYSRHTARASTKSNSFTKGRVRQAKLYLSPQTQRKGGSYQERREFN